MRIASIILGIVIAAIGGVMAYRALFLDPKTTIVITSSDIHEAPNYSRVVGGSVLFIGGAAIAIYGATRRRV